MSYKVGQVYVVAKNFRLSEDVESEHHFVGEHFEITEYEKLSAYPIKTKLIVKVTEDKDGFIPLGGRCLFTEKEIKDNFITYEQWLSLHREEQIKSVLDD